METASNSEDLFSDISDTQLLQLLLADLHDDLPGRIRRFRYLTDLSGALGQSGTMIFGGTPAFAAFTEARSSFVNGNFVATIVLCQGLAEHVLASVLHVVGESLPARINFDETLKRCHARQLITDVDVTDLRRLMNLRNPLSHFRTVDDQQHIDRRAIDAREHPNDMLGNDAHFAVAIVIRLLAKSPFRLGR